MQRSPTQAASRLARPAGALLVLLLLLAAPSMLPTFLLSALVQALIFGVLAMSLDLLMGYTGLVSFGHAAFFGLGAYGAGFVAVNFSAQLVPTLLGALIVSGAGAFVAGLLSLRSRGIYFLMITLALAQLVYAAAIKWTPVTGGSNGLTGIARPSLGLAGVGISDALFWSTTPFYYLTLAGFLLAFLLLRRIVQSPFGCVLQGIRENEPRMRGIGYDTGRYKLAVFILAGLFAGWGGALFAYYNGVVSPDLVYWSTSGQIMIMVIIGGVGTLTGPALGAGLVLALQNLVSSYTPRWQMIMGTVFILFVLTLRNGLAGLGGKLVGLASRDPHADASHGTR